MAQAHQVQNRGQVDHEFLKHCTLTSNVKAGDLTVAAMPLTLQGCDAAKRLRLPINTLKELRVFFSIMANPGAGRRAPASALRRYASSPVGFLSKSETPTPNQAYVG
jgi:hypothetical protein